MLNLVDMKTKEVIDTASTLEEGVSKLEPQAKRLNDEEGYFRYLILPQEVKHEETTHDMLVKLGETSDPLPLGSVAVPSVIAEKQDASYVQLKNMPTPDEWDAAFSEQVDNNPAFAHLACENKISKAALESARFAWFQAYEYLSKL